MDHVGIYMGSVRPLPDPFSEPLTWFCRRVKRLSEVGTVEWCDWDNLLFGAVLLSIVVGIALGVFVWSRRSRPRGTLPDSPHAGTAEEEAGAER